MNKTIAKTGKVRHLRGRKVIRLHVYPHGDAYEIDLDTCRDHQELVGWLRHLAEKAWITGDLLADFMDAWSSATGKPVHHW